MSRSNQHTVAVIPFYLICNRVLISPIISSTSYFFPEIFFWRSWTVLFPQNGPKSLLFLGSCKTFNVEKQFSKYNRKFLFLGISPTCLKTISPAQQLSHSALLEPVEKKTSYIILEDTDLTKFLKHDLYIVFGIYWRILIFSVFAGDHLLGC